MGIRLLVFLVLTPGAGAHGRHVVDLTHNFDRDTRYWPGVSVFNCTTLSTDSMLGKFWMEGNWISDDMVQSSDENTWSHLSRTREKLEQIPLERLIGPAVVIDISFQARFDPDTQLTISDIREWENWHGEIPQNAILAVNSGWSHYWPDATRVLGSTNHNDPTSFHFPGVHPKAARWLVENRPQVTAVAIDTPAVDAGQNVNSPVYHTFANASVVALTNVAYLDQLPHSGSTIFAIPMKIHGGSIGPLRIFAVLHEHDNTAPGHVHVFNTPEDCNSGSDSKNFPLICFLFLSIALKCL